mmetsp:Transcript_43771/g.81696  ORF Transcript_43771/g.81696 Transcript_43771/m.81696 type:complete len:229 (+) Transcript_43771:186-872(+)
MSHHLTLLTGPIPGVICAVPDVSRGTVCDDSGALLRGKRAAVPRKLWVRLHLLLANCLDPRAVKVNFFRERRQDEAGREGTRLYSVVPLTLGQLSSMLYLEEFGHSIVGGILLHRACSGVYGDCLAVDHGRGQVGKIVEAIFLQTNCFTSIFMGTAGHIYDPRRPTPSQGRQEQLCKKKMAQVVDLEDQFEAVLGQDARPTYAGIVHQDLQLVPMLRVKLFGEGPDGC